MDAAEMIVDKSPFHLLTSPALFWGQMSVIADYDSCVAM
jgi:hypothetical protein